MNYYACDPPLVVAMIGRPDAGKTPLLTAMIRAASCAAWQGGG